MSSSESDSSSSCSSPDANPYNSGTIKVPVTQLQDDSNNKRKRKEDGIYNLLTDTNNVNDGNDDDDGNAATDATTFADTTLLCRECEEGFVFSAEEQKFHAEMSFVAPARCKDCRAAKKQRMEELAEGGGGSRYGENRGYSKREKSCYNCGEQGHLSKDCAQPRKEGAGGQARSCYNCGKLGHISKDCKEPLKEHNGGGRRTANGGGGDRACYSCGATGHLSRDCPNQGAGRGGRGGRGRGRGGAGRGGGGRGFRREKY